VVGKWGWDSWRNCMGSVIEKVGRLGMGKIGIQHVVWEMGVGILALLHGKCV